jgi:hypothetical protein
LRHLRLLVVGAALTVLLGPAAGDASAHPTRATCGGAPRHGHARHARRHGRHKRHSCPARHRHVRARAAAAGSTWPATPANASVHCDLFAATSGSDGSGDGGIDKPFATLSRLDAALSPGQTGCLRAGQYGGLSTVHRIDNDGRAGTPITITSYPGELATVVGWVAVQGSYTTLSHLRIDGSNTLYKERSEGASCATGVSQPLDIAGHDDTLEYDEYYQSIPSLRGNGIGIGFWGNADNTVIRFNKIHDVGSCMAYDHLIYLSHGSGVQIYDNWLWNDPHGRGIQLYPAPTNARVWGNVIDHAGVGFGIGDERGDAPSGNHIWGNVVMNSVGLPWEHLDGVAINVWWGGTPGDGNTFIDNDSYNNPGGIGSTPNVSSSGNLNANPQLAGPGEHDYRVSGNSPAAGWNLWNGH